MISRRDLLKLSAGAMVGSRLLSAQTALYSPSADNLKSRQWFQNARYGLFIHWGIYSVIGRGEWVMNQEKIPVTEYEKVASRFNPTGYDPAAWVSLAKQAGMRYITITSKHHDGFAMWGTKQSKWNIVDATPYGKDVLKPLAEECRKQNIRLFFYHSHLDWHNTDYYPLGRTGQSAGRPAGGDFNRYLNYMDAQLGELLTNYGDVAGIWFDGMWDKPQADWHLRRTYDHIHRLQPAAMIGNNHHRAPYPGEDFQMFERDLPGQNTSGFSGESVIGSLPLETCDTLNGSWGYTENDHKYKSPREVVHYLAKAAGDNANFLLNIGPKPDGTIDPEFVSRLQAVGQWLDKNGESIYGTHGGPITPRPWGVTTQTNNTVYLHLLDWPDEAILIPDIKKRVEGATLLSGNRPITIRQSEDGIVLKIPTDGRDPLDTVVVLKTTSV